MTVRDYSTTAASNTSIGAVSVAEGMAAGGLNNAIREMAKDIAVWRAALEAAKTSSGTDTITLTTGLSIASLAVPMMLWFKAGGTNTGAATLAVDGLTAKAIRRVNGNALTAGDITADGIYGVSYEASNDRFILLNPTPGSTSNPVTAGAVITDNALVRGDGGSRGVQESVILADDTTGTIYPTTNDSGALGKAAQSWSDLFLASGGLINWANGTAVITNSGSTINVSTGVLQYGGAVVATLSVENQALTGGATVTSKDLGTVTTGTTTLDVGDRPLQHYINGGAHTLAPGAVVGSTIVDITNNASAGAITTSGFTKVSGDAFTTTNGHKFRCAVVVGNNGSTLEKRAMQ